MSTLRFDIISIGTLDQNLLWKENKPVRTPHTTTTLLRTGNRNILVDPGLPGVALASRLYERTGMRPDQVDTIFLTNFRPSHRSGLDAFPNANVLIHEQERLASRDFLQNLLDDPSRQHLDPQVLHDELQVLETCRPAPDRLADGIDLFPLFGLTSGNCGLLLTLPTITVMLAGGAVASEEHFLAGQLLPGAWDLQAAQESFAEVYEIADLIVPGFGNVFLNPRMHGF